MNQKTENIASVILVIVTIGLLCFMFYMIDSIKTA